MIKLKYSKKNIKYFADKKNFTTFATARKGIEVLLKINASIAQLARARDL